MERKYDAKGLPLILNEVSNYIRNGKTTSPLAEAYLEWLNKYTKYCLPEKVETWKDATRNRLYSPRVLYPGFTGTPAIQQLIDERNDLIVNELTSFMDAGEVMETLDETHSWEAVSGIVDSQEHDRISLLRLTNVMLQYSPYGLDFADAFAPRETEISSKPDSENFETLYKDARDYKEKRDNLNRRLVYALSKGISKTK